MVPTDVDDAHSIVLSRQHRLQGHAGMRACFHHVFRRAGGHQAATAIAAFRNIALRVFSPGEPAAVGAVIRLEARGAQSLYFLGPAHGGLEVEIDGAEVMVVTPSSPLGRSLMGRRTGERVALPQGARTIEQYAVVLAYQQARKAARIGQRYGEFFVP